MGLENTVPRRWYWDFGWFRMGPKKIFAEGGIGIWGSRNGGLQHYPRRWCWFLLLLLLVGVVNR